MVEQGQNISEFLAFVGHVLAETKVAVKNLFVEEVCTNTSSLLHEWGQSIFFSSSLPLFLLREAGFLLKESA